MSRLLTAFVLLLAVAGCSEPPQKEIDQAQSAIDAARAAGADKYVADDYNGAAASLQKARTSVDQRDYRQALSYAIDARQRAIDASRQVPDARAKAKTAAEDVLKRTAAAADALEAALRTAADARVPPQNLRAPHETLTQARTALQEARTALDGRNYAEASATLKGVRENLDVAARQVASIPPRAKPAGRRKK